MSILSKLFGGGSNPADAAKPYLDQIPGVGHQGYDPYVSAGLDASGKTKGQYESLMDDPTGFINKLMESYKTSEGYNFQKDLLTKELSNTAAAGGIAGTPLDQLNQGQQVQGLLSQDMQQYFQNALGVFKTGLSGEEGIAGRGFDASKNLTDLLGNNLSTQGGLAYKNSTDKTNQRNQLIQQLIQLLGAGAGGVFGGGIAGPMSGSSTAPWSNPG